MCQQRLKASLFCITLTLSCVNATQAQKTPAAIDPDVVAKTVAPVVDENTIAVAHIDVARMDVEKVFAAATPFIPAGHPLARMNLAAHQRAESFLEAGGRSLYVIASLADLREHGPFVIVPLTKESDEQSLRAMAGGAFTERMGDVLFFGNQAAHERLTSATPMPRPELLRALESVAGSAAQAVFIPSAAARRVTEELMPTLPAEVGGAPVTTLTRGAVWAALGVDLSPRPSLRLVAQSQSRDAAGALRGYAATLLHDRSPEGAKFAKLLLPEVKQDRLLLVLDSEQMSQVGGVLRSLVDTSAEALRRRESINQFKHIGLAMHNYADVYGHFPPSAIRDVAGRPLLSWRVAVLPFLEQESLYKEFRLDEPWDSEHNRKLIDRMPAVYRSLTSSAAHDRTSFVVPNGAGAVFDGGQGTALREITDGTSNTLMAFEAGDDHSVVWTRPDDFTFDAEHPSAGFTTPYADGRLLLFCDGSVHFVMRELTDETLRRLIVRNDGKPLEELR